MVVHLDRQAKIELLKAIKAGELEVSKIPVLFNELQGGNAFLEIMKKVDEDAEKSI